MTFSHRSVAHCVEAAFSHKAEFSVGLAIEDEKS